MKATKMNLCLAACAGILLAAMGQARAATPEEAKMVAEQQANQARFTQMQTQVEAETAIIRARGEGEAIKVRGEALKLNPAFLRLQIVERWNGKSPLVVPSAANSTGASLLLPLGTPDLPQ